MSSLTERYLAEALRAVPDRQRADMDRELRSSIDDAVEDRVGAGEDPLAAERSVLEGLGNPVRLAAGLAGQPLHLIGPELFLVYRHVLPRLVGVVVPIVTVVVMVLAVVGGRSYVDALLAGIGTAFQVGVQLCFWVTLTFVFLERAEAARDTRKEIVDATRRWTIDMLPDRATDRVRASDTIGEVVSALIGIGLLVFVRDLTWRFDDGAAIPLLSPAIGPWIVAFIAILAAIAVLQVLVFMVGRWTFPLAVGFAVLQLAFTAPMVVFALRGELIEPAFAARIGWPDLAAGDGIPMLAVAVGATVVTAWEIFSAFRSARRSDGAARPIATSSFTTI